jgi:Xaa-Pro aminopeptidase
VSLNESPDWTARLRALDDARRQYDCDAFLVSAPANLRYLTGFAGSAGLLVATAGEAVLLIDGRYHTSVREQQAVGRLAAVTPQLVEGRYDAALADALTPRAVRRVAFEAAHVSVATFEVWRHRLPAVDWRATERVVERSREVKDRVEIDILRRAGLALAGVASRLRELVRAGQRERDVARAIEDRLDAAGFSQPAFPTIVASGPNSALPHARPGDRQLRQGDLVVLDFGGVLDGYCVDLTRVAAVGQVDTRAKELFDAVSAAQSAALAVIRHGVAASAVDQAARDELGRRGLGQAFVHATGHGLGLELHEAPRIARSEHEPPEPLLAGMVCTIEPGAYLPGLAGARLEDDVLVTTTGCEVLTPAPRDLLVV